MTKDKYALKSLDRIPLNQMVYSELKSSIIEGLLKPGEKLSEVHVAKELGVSATPVREAFKRLSSEGYITIKPYIGAVVRSYSVDELVNSYICREALETLMVELAIANIEKEDIKTLYSFLVESYQANEAYVFANVSSKIHNFLLLKAKNTVLTTLLGTLKETMYRDRSMSASNQKRREEIYYEHKLLIEAIEEKNVEKAKAAMSKHIKNGLNYLMI